MAKNKVKHWFMLVYGMDTVPHIVKATKMYSEEWQWPVSHERCGGYSLQLSDKLGDFLYKNAKNPDKELFELWMN